MSTKIKRLRLEREMSQAEMAEKMHMSQSGYAKLENGQSKLDIERLKEISKIFEIDINELIKENENVSVSYHQNTFKDNQTIIGHVEYLVTEVKNQYEKRIVRLEKEIEFLRKIIEKNRNS